jgi:diaminohydroxyphosphoribosylaminopyrimidine deaminase / 5-amino-6-(5-phosphoribosylamino)uracil reductase
MDDTATIAERAPWTTTTGEHAERARPLDAREQAWRSVLGAVGSPRPRIEGMHGPVFEPLLSPTPDGIMIVGQLGQSLDGRIATVTGHSKWINGETGLKHLHRLRAVVDAVMVGVGTAAYDDPRLDTRLVEGPNPARVVIDPRGRLSADAQLLREDGSRRIVITGAAERRDLPKGVETIVLPLQSCGAFQPVDILRALRASGFRRVLLEGGAHTVSRFLDAGCLDRLHVIVAPVIIGAGRAGLSLPAIEVMDHARRPVTRPHLLGDEVLFDCDLSAERVRVA